MDSCSNFATSSCSTAGMHVNAYQTPNCTAINGEHLQQTAVNTPNMTNNIPGNLMLKNAGIYGNNYTTCTNLVIRPGSNHNLVDDVYLPSPYASTRIQLDNETSHLKLDHQQQLSMMEKKSFSNIYDIPQAQCNQQAANQQQKQLQQQQNNQQQNRNNSISIVSIFRFLVTSHLCSPYSL